MIFVYFLSYIYSLDFDNTLINHFDIVKNSIFNIKQNLLIHIFYDFTIPNHLNY